MACITYHALDKAMAIIAYCTILTICIAFMQVPCMIILAYASRASHALDTSRDTRLTCHVNLELRSQGLESRNTNNTRDGTITTIHCNITTLLRRRFTLASVGSINWTAESL